MAPKLFVSALAAVSAAPLFVAAQEEPEPPQLGEPGFEAPNPPSCAVAWFDTVLDLTEMSGFIVDSTNNCAERLGWKGQTPYADKRVYPFHHQRACAGDVLESAALLFSSIGNLEGAAFDCFANNQACGQSIMGASKDLTDAAVALTGAANTCPYTGENYPFSNNKDLPIKGFGCWRRVWRVIQRLTKAAKNIDVAIGSCELVEPEPEPVQPDAAPGPAALGAAPTWNGAAGFSAAAGAPAVERRLAELDDGGDDDIPPMPEDIKEVQLAVEKFLAAHSRRASNDVMV